MSRNFIKLPNAPKTTWERIARKIKSKVVLILGLAALPHFASANPSGGQVTRGKADIKEPNPKNLVVYQETDKAIIEWDSFSIDKGEKTLFIQPSTSSMVLNRVMGSKASEVLGKLKANGGVALVNRSGILFGKDAKVNVGSLIATTSDIRDDNFMSGHLIFDLPGNPGAKIENEGSITLADGGLAALVAPHVENRGVILAKLGKVTIGGGERFTIDPFGDHLVHFALPEDGGSFDIKQLGEIHAKGGYVALTTADMHSVLSSIVNLEGIEIAQTAKLVGDEIVLEGAKASIAGNLEGNAISVKGKDITLEKTAHLNASSENGGGSIYIGFHKEKNQTENLKIEEGAFLEANALGEGKGGEVILFADGGTHFEGMIQAKGMQASGGFAEVSGKDNFYFRGKVDLTAESGTTGTLLIDPTTLEVVPSGAGANQMNSTDIVTNLDSADVTLQADNSITVNAAIDSTGNTNVNNLIFDTITTNLNQPITLKAGATLSGNVDQVHVATGALIQNGIDIADTTGTPEVHIMTGTFNEQLTVDKTLTIRGDGQTNSILDAGGSGTGVTIQGSGVTLQSFKITNADKGILVDPGAPIQSITIHNIDATGNNQTGMEINDNKTVNTLTLDHSTFNQNTVGFRINAGATVNTLNGNDCTFNSNSMGFQVVDDTSVLDGGNIVSSEFKNNTDSGINAKCVRNFEIHGATIAGNTLHGVDITTNAAANAVNFTLRDSILSNNPNEALTLLGPTTSIFLHNNTFSDNGKQFVTDTQALFAALNQTPSAASLTSFDSIRLNNTFDNSVGVANSTNSALRSTTIFSTIQEGISTALDGDWVLVGPGTYSENVLVNKHIKIDGDGPETIISDPTNSASSSAMKISVGGTTTSDPTFVHGVQLQSGGYAGLDISGVTGAVEIEEAKINSNGSQYGLIATANSGAMLLDLNLIEMIGTNTQAAMFLGSASDVTNASLDEIKLGSQAPYGLFLSNITSTNPLILEKFFFHHTFSTSDLFLQGTTTNIDATKTIFDGALNPNDLEARIHHFVDDATLGLVTFPEILDPASIQAILQQIEGFNATAALNQILIGPPPPPPPPPIFGGPGPLNPIGPGGLALLPPIGGAPANLPPPLPPPGGFIGGVDFANAFLSGQVDFGAPMLPPPPPLPGGEFGPPTGAGFQGAPGPAPAGGFAPPPGEFIPGPEGFGPGPGGFGPGPDGSPQEFGPGPDAGPEDFGPGSEGEPQGFGPEDGFLDEENGNNLAPGEEPPPPSGGFQPGPGGDFGPPPPQGEFQPGPGDQPPPPAGGFQPGPGGDFGPPPPQGEFQPAPGDQPPPPSGGFQPGPGGDFAPPPPQGEFQPAPGDQPPPPAGSFQPGPGGDFGPPPPQGEFQPAPGNQPPPPAGGFQPGPDGDFGPPPPQGELQPAPGDQPSPPAGGFQPGPGGDFGPPPPQGEFQPAPGDQPPPLEGNPPPPNGEGAPSSTPWWNPF